MFNKEVKELKGKLAEADCQKQKLQEEVTALREKVEATGTDVVQQFRRCNCSLTPMPTTTALGSTIVLSKSR